MVKVDNDRYLDITGVYSGCDLIFEWYRELGTIRQMTEIFLVDDGLNNKISCENKKNYQSPISEDDRRYYQFEQHLNDINYEYSGSFNLDQVCYDLIKSL